MTEIDKPKQEEQSIAQYKEAESEETEGSNLEMPSGSQQL